MEKGFNVTAFMEYLQKSFNGFENPFLRGMVNNIIEYGLKRERVSKDQFCYWISDLFPEISFGEVAAFMDDANLTSNGRWEKQEAIRKYNIE